MTAIERKRETDRQYRIKNRDKIREYQRRYNKEHPEKKKAWCKKYIENNKEKVKASSIVAAKKYRENNPEKIKEIGKRYRETHPEKTRERFREWRKKAFESNNQYKIRFFLRSQLNARIKSTSNKKSYLVGCTPLELREHIQSQFQDGMTWENYGEWHIDHIKPCSLFDLTDKEQRKACFHFSNLQPLWAIDNITKGNKYGKQA